MKKDTTAESQDKFKELRNRVTHLLRKSEGAHATKFFRQTRLQPSETASKSFWQHMKRVQGKSKPTVIPKLISNDNTATTDLEKVEVLNGFFSSQTILPNCGTSFPDKLSLPENTRSFPSWQAMIIPPQLTWRRQKCWMASSAVKQFCQIVEPPFQTSCPSLKTPAHSTYCTQRRIRIWHSFPPQKKESPWDWQHHPDLLRLCAKGIAGSLSALFNKSFASSTFPTQWKMALGVPIFKKGDKCNPGNYRSISSLILSVLSKVVERVVHENLSNFLRPWLTKNQPGFKKADGTVPQLVHLTQEWSQMRWMTVSTLELCSLIWRQLSIGSGTKDWS